MQLAVVAFVFGVLLFLASAAALALEPQAPGVWRLCLLVLATLHATAGFLAIGGASAFAEHHWGAVAGCSVAGTAATAIAGVIAFQLAGAARLMLPQTTAILILASALAAGVLSIVLVIRHPPTRA